MSRHQLDTQARAGARVVARVAAPLVVVAGLLSGLTGPTTAPAPAVPASVAVAAVPVAEQGCLGPDAVCEVGGAIASGVASGVAGGVGGVGKVATGAAKGVTGAAGAVGGCGLLGALCDSTAGDATKKADDGEERGGGMSGALGALAPAPGVLGLAGMLSDGFEGLSDIPNPMAQLGDIIAKAAADAWTAAMLAIWNSGLFVLRIVLTFSEMFLTPDLRGNGPGKDVYSFTLWLALSMVVILTLIQLGAAAFKREGKSLARALIGAGQFVVICASWFGYCAMVVAACGAITKALMKSLLKVNTWPEWEPLGGLGINDITDATVATVLAFLGLFLWLAAIGHILVYLGRAASLLVLTATGPLSAAGLVSDFTRAWFWKSLRWFHAASFTPVLMVVVLGIGVQMSNGVAANLSNSTQKAIGTALPAVMLILVSVVAPMALFKLLAFVDPGTPSGASFRQGMAAVGGAQGLLSGAGSGGGSTAASSTDSHGRSSGEQSAEGATGDRFTQSAQGLVGSFGAPGAAMSKGMSLVMSAGAKGASLMADETNQAGVGQSTYGPDFSNARTSQNNGQASGQGGQQGGRAGGDDDAPTFPPSSMPPTPPMPALTPSGPPSGGSPGGRPGNGPGNGGGPKPPGGGGGAGAAGGGAGGAAGGAAAVPPVV